MQVEIRLLGVLEASRNGAAVELGSAQQRTLLALLALNGESGVSLDAIVDVLWPSSPPASATKIVQTYISRLRKALGDEAIERRGRGYRLSEAVETDAATFETLLAAGRRRDALSLWRGPALTELALLRDDAARLDEIRLQAIEAEAGEATASGNAARTIPQLQRLVADYPLREGLVARLMEALYSCGRQADALDVYRAARSRLVDELGLEPGAELRTLERRILRQDPTLGSPAGNPPRAASRSITKRRPRRRVIAFALVLIGAAVAASAVFATHGHARIVAIRPDTILRIDPATNEIVDAIPVGRAPSGILVRGRYAWVANEGDRTLTRIDLKTHDTRTIGGVSGVGFLARDGAGNVYSSGWDFPFVWRVGHASGEVDRRFRVRTRAVGIAIGGGFLFVVDRLANGVTSVGLGPPHAERFVRVGADPLVATFGSGALWVGNSDDATVSVLRPGVERPHTIDVDPKPFGIASGFNAVWVGSNQNATVSRIDPDTLRVVKRIDVRIGGVNPGTYAVATGAGAVWALNADVQSIERIDPQTNRVVATIPLPFSVYPRQLSADGDEVWVSVTAPGEGP